MINPLKQAGDLAKMAKQAKQMQKMLDAEEVVVEEDDIRVVITGSQKIKSFSIQGMSNDQVVEVLNKAIQRSQKAAAGKMQEMAGGLSGLMGMMGGK
jgi:DNA-binding protein YbaB